MAAKNALRQFQLLRSANAGIIFQIGEAKAVWVNGVNANLMLNDVRVTKHSLQRLKCQTHTF